MEAMSRRVLEMVDGCRVVVPDSIDLITPYVLQEQQDWFEEEIRFVRRALEPGQRAIDIGANYGLFTLSMARVLGPSGHVWAFEPASGTASFLEASLRENSMDNVSVRRAGISVRAGIADLVLNANAEMNEISRAGGSAGPTERIELCSLDELDASGTWDRVDFLKIDAEGEELRIIEGAASFLKRHSPLVQMEVKAGSSVSLDPLRCLMRLGYEAYRLVPGLGVLVPFDLREAVDPFMLNVMCCRADRAGRLAARALLVDASGIPPSPGPDVLAGRNGDGRYNWPASMAAFEYVRELSSTWAGGARTNERAQVERALAMFALSRDADVPPRDRFLALRRSLELLHKAASAPDFMRRASLARVACAFGARAQAAMALDALARTALERRGFDLSEPFLVPCERFERIPIAGRNRDWAFAAVSEAFEHVQAFSSYYSATSSLGRLREMVSLGFAGPEMHRRLELVQARLASGS